MHYMDESIVEGMRLRDNDVIQYVYKSHYPTIKYFVKLNNGDEEDVKDIFQEAIIIIYKKANNNEHKKVYNREHCPARDGYLPVLFTCKINKQ